MPLSKEEKQKRKEEKKLRKLQAEEEKRIKLRREYLEREFVLGKVNVEALKEDWHKMCLDARLPQIKDDMQVMWHWFERTVDLKDDTIIHLIEDLSEAEVQYRRALQSHADNVDNLLVYYNNHIDSLSEAYQTDLEELMKRMKGEKSYLTTNQDHDEDYLNTIMFAMETIQTEAVIFINSENISKMDEEVNKNANDLDVLRSLLEKQVELMWSAYKSTLSNYQKSTDERQKQYLVLKEKDDSAARLMEKQMIRMTKLIDEISQKKEQLLNVRSAKKELIDLQSERNTFHDTFWAMKNTLSDQMKHDDFQFQTLAINSDLTMKSLDRIVEKGKRILKLGGVCSTLETEHEKVMPFSNQTQSETIPKEKHSFQKLEKFWLRVGNAEFSRLQLTALVKQLQIENDYLKNVLENTLNSFKSSEANL